jgi:gustatory receptor
MEDVEFGNLNYYQENIHHAKEHFDDSFRFALKPGEFFKTQFLNKKFQGFFFPFSALLISQLFGFFPYQNLISNDISKIRFKRSSLRYFYSRVLILNSLTHSILNAYKHISTGPLKPSNFNGVIFYASSTAYCILFHQIDWKYFFVQWSEHENCFLNEKYKHPPSTWTLKQKIHACTLIGFFGFIVNQICFFASKTQKVLYVASVCEWTNHNFFQDFVVEHLDHVFNLIPYHPLLGILTELGNFATTFYWNLPDIFIMLVSIGISYRFEQINKRIDYLRGRVACEERWNEIRMDYVKVCELLKVVDKALGKIILLVSLNNSYLTLIQLLNILA